MSHTIKNFIRQEYSKIARQEKSSCCGGGCSCNASLDLGYTQEDINNAPAKSNMGLGSGNPVVYARLKEGEVVLDLGCGGGFDCFLARKEVGDDGYVIGVDMTADMINLAKANLGKTSYQNIDFILGEIEHLPIENEAIDVIISNCVINLSLEKSQVFKEAYRVLKKGGRLSIFDSVAVKEIPQQIRQDLYLRSSCIAGAESADNIKKMLEAAGFSEIKLTLKSPKNQSSCSCGTDKTYTASYLIEALKR